MKPLTLVIAAAALCVATASPFLHAAPAIEHCKDIGANPGSIRKDIWFDRDFENKLEGFLADTDVVAGLALHCRCGRSRQPDRALRRSARQARTRGRRSLAGRLSHVGRSRSLIPSGATATTGGFCSTGTAGFSSGSNLLWFDQPFSGRCRSRASLRLPLPAIRPHRSLPVCPAPPAERQARKLTLRSAEARPRARQ